MQQPIRITYLIDNLLRAGTQTALSYLVEGLAARGYRQRVFCLNSRFDPAFVQTLESYGVDVVVLGKNAFITGAAFWSVFRALRRSEVVQTFLPFSDLLGRFLGRLASVPVIVTSIRARNIDKKTWQLMLDRLTMRWAHRVVFNAANVVDFSLANEGVRSEQVVVIPNGVRLRESSVAGREALPDEIPPEARVMGMVGRLRAQKGVDVLLEAFRRLESDPVHLVIVGDGELRDALEMQAKEMQIAPRVHFLGMRSDLPEIYTGLDLYVHTAIFEGMPNAVMEAMASGLPVVATAADGTRELIRDGETGWLVPVGDAGAMADAIDQALGDPGRRAQLGAAAAAFMKTQFSVEKMVDSFARLYETQLTGVKNGSDLS